MARKRITKLTSYLGKTIKGSVMDVTLILDEFKIKKVDHQLLERRYPFEHPNRNCEEGVLFIGKYVGKGQVRNPFIYITKTKTGWFRLATEEERKTYDEEPVPMK